MTLFFRLFAVQLRQRFGLSVMRAGWKDNPKRTIGHAALYAFVAISMLALVGMYVWLLNALMPVFVTLKMETLVLGIVLLVSMVVVFFMGLIYLIGSLFFAKDTEFLAALPIPQRTVFAVKFGQVLLGEIATSALLILPACVVYAIHVKVDWAFALRTALTVLAAPCIPLAISGLLALVLMRFSALWRRREVFTVVGSILLVVVIIAGQAFLTSALPETMTEGAITALLSDNSALLRTVVSAFPPSGWAAEGLVGNFLSFALFIGVSIVALCIVTLIAGRMYYRGAMAQAETASNRRAVSLTGNRVRAHSPMRTLFVREWRVLLRTPVYVLNGLTMIILGPLLLLFPLLFQGSGMQGENELAMLSAVLRGAVDSRLIMLILAAIYLFVCSINPAGTSTMSREGKNYYLMRMIPVTANRQMAAKLLFSLSISTLAIGITALTAAVFFGLSVSVALGSFVLAVAVSVGMTAFSMLPDILRPKLSWNSETEAIKQNMNAVLGMAIAWVLVVLLGVGCYFAISGGIDLGWVLAALLAASAVMGAASVLALFAAMRRTLRVLEG